MTESAVSNERGDTVEQLSSDGSFAGLSPLDYARKVKVYSRSSIRDSLHGGYAYRNLAEFLDTKSQTAPTKSAPPSSPEDAGFAWLYELKAGTSVTACPLSLPLHRSTQVDIPEHNSLLILNGYPSAEWINEIGSKYNIDPEFFHRHLSFLQDDHLESHPPAFTLPSHQSTIFQLSIISVGSQEDSRHAGIESKRIDSRNNMEAYLHNLKVGRGWRLGHSIVRSYAVHDNKEFSIQQLVTVYVARVAKTNDRWLCVIWLDSGADLSSSPKGPWREYRGAQVRTSFRPVCQYKPNAAMKDRRLRRDTAAFGDRIAQSLSLLSAFYGTSLNANIMWSDPFYTLGELFNFFISSETQFLNSIATKLDDGMRDLSFTNPSASMKFQAELLYFRRIIDKRVQSISQTLMFIKTRHHLDWPRPREAIEDGRTARLMAKAAIRLEHDCEYALNCATSLQQRCERETTIMMNNASIAEAKRGIDQGRQLFRFSVIVSIYVPLSFTTSVFGMNFVQFPNHAMGFWVWPLVTLPIFVASLLILVWDFENVRQWRMRVVNYFIGLPAIER